MEPTVALFFLPFLFDSGCMLFSTVAEYDAEIAEVRDYLKAAMRSQSFTSGAPTGGMQYSRGDVRAQKEYLELLSKERNIVAAREAGGAFTKVQFERPL